MLTQETLKQQACILLPRGPLRDEFFRQRTTIRSEIARSRRLSTYRVYWDDPEFVARVALLLTELAERPSNHINMMASG